MHGGPHYVMILINQIHVLMFSDVFLYLCKVTVGIKKGVSRLWEFVVYYCKFTL